MNTFYQQHSTYDVKHFSSNLQLMKSTTKSFFCTNSRRQTSLKLFFHYSSMAKMWQSIPLIHNSSHIFSQWRYKTHFFYHSHIKVWHTITTHNSQCHTPLMIFLHYSHPWEQCDILFQQLTTYDIIHFSSIYNSWRHAFFTYISPMTSHIIYVLLLPHSHLCQKCHFPFLQSTTHDVTHETSWIQQLTTSYIHTALFPLLTYTSMEKVWQSIPLTHNSCHIFVHKSIYNLWSHKFFYQLTKFMTFHIFLLTNDS
jgi:hypothetical protein